MRRRKRTSLTFLIVWSICLLPITTEALLRRCYSCRSRGERGSCKDPFKFNITLSENEPGLESVPCASGWCGKYMEGGTTFKDDDYGVATQRMCLQRGPSDNEERCAYTVWGNKKVYMCFCQGDLCNTSSRISLPNILLFVSSIVFRILHL